MKNLPPLNALRAFVAVVRSGSIAQGARDMGISGSALSQQIKNLENWLGLSLFDRMPRDFKLTDQGREYFDEISTALNVISRATSNLVGKESLAGPIRISVLPAFSTLWLLPKLDSFTSQYPDIEINLMTSTTLCNLQEEDVDFAIRYGEGDYLGLESEKLLPEAVAPACHPSLIEGYLDKGVELEDLLALPVINDEGSLKGIKYNLGHWLEAQGVKSADFKEVLRFSDSNQACEAARLGKGMILGRACLLADWLEAGDLVTPIDHWEIEKTAYWIVYSGARPMRPQVKLFYNWLKGTAKEWLATPGRQKIFNGLGD